MVEYGVSPLQNFPRPPGFKFPQENFPFFNFQLMVYNLGENPSYVDEPFMGKSLIVPFIYQLTRCTHACMQRQFEVLRRLFGIILGFEDKKWKNGNTECIPGSTAVYLGTLPRPELPSLLTA